MKSATADQSLAPSPLGALVELKGVTLTAGARHVLQDISFSAAEPRVGIVGRNGSGKTTLARVISGLVAPDQGTARIEGTDVFRDRKAALGLVGILFQNPDRQIIFPTVEEELGFGLRQMGLDKADADDRVSQILARFGKSHWAKAPTHLLSQGQKQLVCLMAILSMAPRVIILDEPFAGLDISTRMQLQRSLDRVDAQLFHISHDPQHLESYDRVLWIEAGQLKADGPAPEVLPAFTSQMTKWGTQDDLSDLPA
ncbi:ABC transporter ATP-binding protein [Phaeobacter sp. QD34_3]|uniref:energy-coupling factor ABC transporter ATP-binding protein n=1 Tax=unclassified Phaeobacter TaxID=2621772 RepID=UPI00237F45FC|nr:MULTISPECIES: ABC transporter ATP-binding protein [unclassified Phaeobacter]MDE4134391.1 ABC transporter ATP-binding protein [Phaeobacter sp. QD34_3]MDE4137724.1 ABC transporter ATP-binding protein [Phaeobacter sp. QD34_24]MDE4172854.1 ABC transporter ATP-binding protein [Phaeobacter sp. PT47_59]